MTRLAPTPHRRSGRLILAIAAASCFAGQASGHGASRGMHLHVEPEPARAGRTVRVELNVSEPIVRARVGFAGHPPVLVEPERPVRSLKIGLVVPADDRRGVVIIQAEAERARGAPLRGTAVVRVSPGVEDPGKEQAEP